MKKSYWILILIASFSFAQSYWGAEIYTKNSFHYGRFEARMQMAAASGSVSSMFLYYDNSWMGGTEPWREVDIEVLGKTPGRFQSNIITGSAAKRTMSEQLHTLVFDVSKGFHTYAMEWTPDYIAWSIDGTEVRRSSTQQVIDCRDKSQALRFNLWSSIDTGWVGPWNDANLPLYQYINWVKVYSYDSIAKTFALDWEDTFDSFDSDRWGLGNWTFTGNRVTFAPENAVVQDGMLVLALTQDPNLGFSGGVPVDQGTTKVNTYGREPQGRHGSSQIQLEGNQAKIPPYLLNGSQR